MNNYKDAAVGKRIRLLETMKNINSTLLPKESVPVGMEGTIVSISIHGDKWWDQITVKWDSGQTLGLFPHQDNYEVLNVQ